MSKKNIKSYKKKIIIKKFIHGLLVLENSNLIAPQSSLESEPVKNSHKNYIVMCYDS